MNTMNTKAISIGLSAATIMCAGSALCAKGKASTYSLAPIGGDATTAMVVDAPANAVGIVKVTGRGVGSDRAAALKDAYRDAVESAVGMYVDAEQMVKNDELLKDQVLTQSNAYIEKCDVVKEENIDGLVQVRIVAQVRKTVLVKKISEMMPVQNVALGDTLQNLHATIVTTESRNMDGAALMRNALEGVDPCKQLMKATLAANKPKVMPVQGNANKVRIMYPFQVEVDKERYLNDFMPKMKQVLDQISITPPKKIRIAEIEGWLDDHEVKRWQQYLANGPDGMLPIHGGLYMPGVFDGYKAFRMGVSGIDVFWCCCDIIRFPRQFRVDNWPLQTQAIDERMAGGEPFKDGLPVVLVTDLKGSGMTGFLYTVDSVAAKVVNDWLKKCTGTSCNDCPGMTGPRYEIVFKDARDEELAAGRWELRVLDERGSCRQTGYRLLFNCVYVSLPLPSNGRKDYWIISPLLRASAERYIEWVSFDVQKDDLAKIASVSIELAD